LAVCAEVKRVLGIRVYHAGAVYDLADQSLFGRIAEGRRGGNRWANSSR
jgi:hypothetical protein